MDTDWIAKIEAELARARKLEAEIIRLRKQIKLLEAEVTRSSRVSL